MSRQSRKRPRVDIGHQETEKLLADLEKRIAEEYTLAEEEVKRMVATYLNQFAKEEARLKGLLEAGEIDKEYYRKWLYNQTLRSTEFKQIADNIASRMADVSDTAYKYLIKDLDGVYALNRTYASYLIDSPLPNDARIKGFLRMWDERTVRKLLVEQPDLMPHYSIIKAIYNGYNLAYCKRQITKVTTSCIISGTPVREIANILCKRVTGMNYSSAIRTARTAYTKAQNAGRQDACEEASEMGIAVGKEWMSFHDDRTREAHGEADGQIVPYDEPFIVGGEEIPFPGDDSLGASAWNIYNCRCTMREVPLDYPNPPRYTWSKWKEEQEETDAD